MAMVPNTYSQVYIHAVFAVAQRENVISEKFRNELHAYMAGILSNLGCFPLAIGGTSDHVHLFFELKINLSISDIIRDVKRDSSKWVNENHFVSGHFSWQRGSGVFSHAKSGRDEVVQYIQNQETHHRKSTFKEEYLAILNKLDIKYSDDYLFEF